jgi:alginate production protein
MSIRCLFLSLLLVFATPLAASKKTSPELYFLQKGQHLKVDTALNSKKRWVAKKIELVSGEDEFQIEGNVQKLDRKGSKFLLGTLKILIYEKTKFESAQKEPRALSDVRNGDRVRVKARSIKGKTVKARTIRIFGPSADTDVELTGPIDRINLDQSEILLLSSKISVDRKTRYVNLDTTTMTEYAEESGDGRYIRRDDDDQHPDPIRLGRLMMGGQINFQHERSREFDLNSLEPDSEDFLRPGGEVEMSLPWGESSEMYAKFNFVRPMLMQEHPGRSENDFNLREFYLLLGLHRSVGLQVGRQRFRDRREWLFDEQLDAVRLHLNAGSRLRMQLAAAQNLVNPTGSRSDQMYLIAHSELEFSERRYVSGHAIKRNDVSSRDEDPIWYGLGSRGRIWRGFDYWAEGSSMRGRREKRLLRGYGYDAGASYRLPLPLQPTIAAGYAFGSGDNNLDDGIDGNFRQTRLNDNSYRYNGLKRYRYYGVLTEPELYNLKIQTLDVGIRHTRYWSLNFSAHNYRQAVASKKVGDMALTAAPRGRDPRLGKEFDAVLVIRRIPRVDINLFGGLFLPGPAFTGERARAFLFRQEIKFYF